MTEKAVLDYFSHKKLSSSTKVNIASVFEAQTGSYSDSARRILTYLPNLHRLRKNIQYLTEEETQAIRSVLSGNDGGLCLCNRAIGAVLYFTGMRSSDVAGLKFSDIDWEKEEIRIIQKKTGEELLLPLRVLFIRSLSSLRSWFSLRRESFSSRSAVLSALTVSNSVFR